MSEDGQRTSDLSSQPPSLAATRPHNHSRLTTHDWSTRRLTDLPRRTMNCFVAKEVGAEATALAQINPVVSAQPVMMLKFWTAWPAAPFIRLSSALVMTSCVPRTNQLMSQKFV